MESNLLFPRKFDQSRWVFCFDIDLALRSVEWRLHGWGGRDGELIIAEEALPSPLESWSEAFHYGSRSLWAQLEVQLDPER